MHKVQFLFLLDSAVLSPVVFYLSLHCYLWHQMGYYKTKS